jgi:hypothetical protein
MPMVGLSVMLQSHLRRMLVSVSGEISVVLMSRRWHCSRELHQRCAREALVGESMMCQSFFTIHERHETRT